MNATSETRVVRATPHTTHKILMLLKREFWEHKGGFFWAPLIAGGIFLLFSVIAGGAGQMFLQRQMGGRININGKDLHLGEVDWAELIRLASPEDIHQLNESLNILTLTAGIWPYMVFGIVVFFYLLGALYDERKDRSVLFWKSLPISDAQTVLSKVLMALILGPLITAVISLLIMVGFVLIFSGIILLNGSNPFPIYLSRLDPLLLIGSVLSWMPINALWAMPTVGWLLLCSAAARSKPFLWAIMLPVFTGLLISWFDLLRIFKVESSWFWQHIVGRLLASAIPGSHSYSMPSNVHPNTDTGTFIRFFSGIDMFGQPNLWIGAAAGIAMVAAAIRLRRWRDEG